VQRESRNFSARRFAMRAPGLPRRTGSFTIGWVIILLVSWVLFLAPDRAIAQVNGQGQLPYLGWSSWSQEALKGESWLTEAEIEAQSDALKSSGLQSHGYLYINIDSGWQVSFDEYGRPTVNTAKFPDGMAATIQYIHNNGQKAGIYWIPGVQQPVYDSNSPILGTSYFIDEIVQPDVPGNAFSFGQSNPWHKKIDFTQPGANAYINSVVDLFASWGVDLIKLDGVTPGSDHDNLTVDNRADVAAWSQAIAQSGRPMWLTISWALDPAYISTWQTYSNAKRIEDDVDCYCATLTNWTAVSRRFGDLATWQSDAGPASGWNDLDSLDIGNGIQDGLTNDERQSAMSLWAIANAPLYTGDDLTQLDSFGQQLLENDAVIAVDQSGVPATEIQGGNTPVWALSIGGGIYYVALFNLGDSSNTVSANWSNVGFSGSAAVQDLWSDSDLGVFNGMFSTVINPHASRLLRVAVSNYGLTPPTIALTASPATSIAGSPVTITAAVSSPSGTPSGSVNFYVESNWLGTGTISAGIASLTTTTLPTGSDSITAVYQGDSRFGTVTSDPLVIAIDPAFGITASPTSLSLTSLSKQATSQLIVTPGGRSSALSFACAGLPSFITCSFSPSTLALAGVEAPQTVVMTVSNSSTSAELPTSPFGTRKSVSLCVLFFFLPMSIGFVLPNRRRRSLAKLLGLVIFGVIAIGWSGCGQSSYSASPSGPVSISTVSFVVNVTAASTLVQTIPYSVVVQ
jgi:hypothetical protein